MKNEEVTQRDENSFNEKWRDEMIIPEKYEAHRDEFIQVLSEFEDMWYEHLGCIKAARYCSKLTSNKLRSGHSAPYHAGPIARKFTTKNLQKIPQQEVTDPANTEMFSPIVFASTKDCLLRFSVYYQKVNKVIGNDSNQLPGMESWTNSVGEARIFPTLDASSGHWESRIEEGER